MIHTIHDSVRGFSFIEMIITIAIVALVFGGIFASVQSMLQLMSHTKVTTSALALANEKIEYIRSLSYDDVGTVSGIPNGLIPQYATSTLNGIVFHERVLIEYVDSPDDGSGAADSNGILADYKKIKVEYSWLDTEGATSSIYLITTITPSGIETTAGGGTLVVNVFDADVQPLQGASVRLFNDTGTSTIDVTKHTNIDGVAIFAGAPANANYEIFVTKSGYSLDQTREATTSLPNPTTLPVAVVLGAVTTMNFQIDELSDLTVETIEPITETVFMDTFSDSSLITSSSDTEIIGGDVVLTGGTGSYSTIGTMQSTSSNPITIDSWYSATWDATVPALTTLTTQVYSVSPNGIYTLIPDAALPNNSIGFTDPYIDLRSLDPNIYPRIALGATFTTSDVNQTPVLHSWAVSHVAVVNPISNIPLSIHSTKTIGTDVALLPVYKYENSIITDGLGSSVLNDMEWDSYVFTLSTSAYDVAEACADIPYVLDPNVDETLTISLLPHTVRSIRVSVIDTENNPIFGADITLTRAGFSEVLTTSPCGQVFFNTAVPEATDFEVTIEKDGYATQTVTPVVIDGTEVLQVMLTTS
jgi:prepilin-type N-terminal cleavage/methylation domain-containing protein